MRFVSSHLVRQNILFFASALLGAIAIVGSFGDATAKPLVTMEGDAARPGIVTAWKSEGKKVRLSLAPGTDAQALAKAIADEVGVKTKVKGDEILVIGKEEKDLLVALANLSFGDDIGALAAATLVDAESESGSSLRAKKKADLAKVLADATSSATGKVGKIVRGPYPATTVTVTISRAPTGELGKAIRKGKSIEFTPVLAKKGDAIDWSDETTQQNAGAWYLEPGDRVTIKVGNKHDASYEALVIAR